MTTRTPTFVWILAGLFVLCALPALIQSSRSDYLTWRGKRDVFHQHCDEYVNQPVTAANREPIRACQRELAALWDEAKAKGWAK